MEVSRESERMKFSSNKFQERFVGTVKDAKVVDDTTYHNKKLVLRILSKNGTERDFKYTITEAPKGKMAQLVNALKGLGIDNFEEKDLIGKTFTWERRDMNFVGMDGAEVASFLYVPITIENAVKQTAKPSTPPKQDEPIKAPETVKPETEVKDNEKDIDWSELDEKLKDGLTNSAIKRIGTKIGATREEIDGHMEQLDQAGKLKEEGEEYFIVDSE